VDYIEPWGLLGSLAGITLLMAVTAILIVRFGKVWEDARSLILIVLLMLLAISVSSDELVNVLADKENSREHLALMFGLGTLFVVGVCELLIRGLAIRFSAGYRLPLYGFLILFSAWPATLLTELTGLNQAQTRWLIIAFPLLSGLLTMSLIPAVRKGASAVAENGTPWGWPLFPWTPFVFIALAVCFRSYLLTMSFDPLSSSGHYWDTMFGLYQLVPFLLAILVLLLEIGIAENLPRLRRGVMLAAPALLLLAYPWMVPWGRLRGYSEFTQSVVMQIASPVFLTILGLMAMYAWAWWKGVRHAEAGVFAMVLLTTVIGPRAFGYRTWSLGHEDINWWPMLIMGLIQIAVGIRRKVSFRTMVGLMILLLVFYQSTGGIEEVSTWRGLLSVNLFLAAVLAVGFYFRDRFSEFLRAIGPPLISSVAAVSFVMLFRERADTTAMIGYGAAMVALPFLLAWLFDDRGYLAVGVIHSTVAGVVGAGTGSVRFARTSLPDGVKPVILAFISFLIAVFISVLKSGLSRRLRICWLTKRRRVTG